MTTVGDAILAAITANWAVPTGGVIPKLYSTEDTKSMPGDDDFVWMLTYTLVEKYPRFNTDFIRVEQTITMLVSSKNDANDEERLDTIVTELRRIINPTNVTGYHKVDVVRSPRLPSEDIIGTYRALVTVELINKLTSSSVTPGSTATSDWEVDNLTVNTDLDASTATVALGETTMSGDILMQGNELAFDTATLHDQANNFHMHPASGNADIKLVLHPLGTNTKSTFQCRNAVSPANYGALEFSIDGATGSIVFVQGGAGTPPTKLEINGYDHEAALMIGTANAAWVPCVPIGADDNSTWKMTNARVINTGAVDFYMDFLLPIPCNRGGLKLYLKSLKYGLFDADDGDYLTTVVIRGQSLAAGGSVRDTDNTDHKTAGDKTFAGATFPAAVLDVSAYQSVMVGVNVVATNANDFDLINMRMECYYDT